MIPFNKNISDYFMTFIYPFREKVIIPKISRNYNSCINYFLYVFYIYKLKFIYEVTNTITKWLKKRNSIQKYFNDKNFIYIENFE